MNKHIRHFLAVASLAVLPQAAYADTGAVSDIDLNGCGIYTLKVAGREDDAKSASGKHTSVEIVEIVQETRKVPGRLGVSFGCRVSLKGDRQGTDGVITALIRPPAGAKNTKSGAPLGVMRGERTYTIGGRGGYVGYTFRAEERLAPGTWVIETWADGKKLADAAFDVEK